MIGLPTWLGALVWSFAHHSGAVSLNRAGQGVLTAFPASGDVALLLGSAAVLLLMAALLQTAGAVVARRWWLIPYGLLTPLYWVLLGIAVWRSVWQLIFAPFGWEKTSHGNNVPVQLSAERVGKKNALMDPREEILAER